MAANPFSQFIPYEYVSNYIPLPLQEYATVGSTLQDKFDKVQLGTHKLALARDAIKTAPFEGDIAARDQLVGRITESLDEMAEKGNYHRLGDDLMAAQQYYSQHYTPLAENLQRYQGHMEDLGERYKKGEITRQQYDDTIKYSTSNYKGFDPADPDNSMYSGYDPVKYVDINEEALNRAKDWKPNEVFAGIQKTPDGKFVKYGTRETVSENEVFNAIKASLMGSYSDYYNELQNFGYDAEGIFENAAAVAAAKAGYTREHPHLVQDPEWRYLADREDNKLLDAFTVNALGLGGGERRTRGFQIYQNIQKQITPQYAASKIDMNKLDNQLAARRAWKEMGGRTGNQYIQDPNDPKGTILMEVGKGSINYEGEEVDFNTFKEHYAKELLAKDIALHPSKYQDDFQELKDVVGEFWSVSPSFGTAMEDIANKSTNANLWLIEGNSTIPLTKPNDKQVMFESAQEQGYVPGPDGQAESSHIMTMWVEGDSEFEDRQPSKSVTKDGKTFYGYTVAMPVYGNEMMQAEVNKKIGIRKGDIDNEHLGRFNEISYYSADNIGRREAIKGLDTTPVNSNFSHPSIQESFKKVGYNKWVIEGNEDRGEFTSSQLEAMISQALNQ